MAKLMSFFSPPEEEILGLHDVHPRRIREARARDNHSSGKKTGTPSGSGRGNNPPKPSGKKK
ncbi:MAG: hypothetical protein MJE68_19260 [Proteobacteria bacterium]|nr:hypothetical protein [Pseudomonadota bacterium]